MIEPAPPLPEWLAMEMPFARRAVRVLGRRMVLVDEGPRTGTAVVMVHGNPTWSYLWRKVIAHLRADGLRLIAPDLFGFGQSDTLARPADHRLAFHIDAVARALDALEVEDAIVVGQDWGGPIAMGAGARLGARLRGVVLGNTAVLAPVRPFRPKLFHRLSQLPVVSDALFRGLLFPVPFLDRTQGDRRSIGVREKLAYAWPFRRLADRAGPLGMARMVPDAESHPSTAPMDEIGRFVAGWRGPTRLVWGLRDPILGRGLRRHREALPHAQVRECEAGHFLQEEVPRLFAEAVREVRGSQRL